MYDILVIECEGLLEGGEPGTDLRAEVVSHYDASAIVLDLSRVYAIGDGGTTLLIMLQRWARERDIRFKIFNPTISVLYRLQTASSMSPFEIATLDEIMALTAVPRPDMHYFQHAA